MIETNPPAGLFRDRVRERDLDNFLVEELQASEAFRAWLLDRLPPTFRPPSVADIRLQKSPPRQDGRQTDVRLGWFEADRLVACVLIESKVTADFQPGQAEAYRLEAERHRHELGADRCCSLLVAPAAALERLQHADFEATLTIESMAASLGDRVGDADLAPELRTRLGVRIDLLEALAGKRSGSAWTPVTIAGKRDFAAAYAALAEELLPTLRVRPSTDGPKALTRFYEGLALPAEFPAKVRLKHEFGGDADRPKYANLQIAGAVGAVEAILSSGLLAGTPFELARSEKSLFIRGPTPGLDPTAPFEPQRERVIEGIAVIGRLADWIADAAPRLAMLLVPPAPTSTLDEHAPTISMEKAFDREMRSLCEASIRAGYRPGDLIDMVGARGGLGAARALLTRPHISDGFTALWEMGLPELTVEALVIQPKWRDLFAEAERATARRRLKGWRGLAVAQ